MPGGGDTLFKAACLISGKAKSLSAEFVAFLSSSVSLQTICLDQLPGHILLSTKWLIG